MSSRLERAYVRQWAETGQLLEAQRWQELRMLSSEAAMRAADSLIRAALLVPLPERRRHWSGLVDLQDALHGRKS